MEGSNSMDFKKIGWFQWLEIAGSVAAVIGIVIAVFDYRRKVAADDLANKKVALDTQLAQLQIEELQKKNA